MSTPEQPEQPDRDRADLPHLPADLFDPWSGFSRHRWVRDRHGRIGYLGSNSHTFRGRFLTYWVHEGAAYSTSLHELSECSEASADWLHGFLSGSEPPPPDDLEETEASVAQWREAALLYQRTGVWGRGRVCEVCGNELPPSAPVGFRCVEHGTTEDHWPSIKQGDTP
jgi:hypothetical protein